MLAGPNINSAGRPAERRAPEEAAATKCAAAPTEATT